ncbi:MAG TPA: Hsp20/alpha crystallin family protein [candidate division Zixibacteria bacterium]|nr:Hsp20/alpha crystallin family protein [candidate division Zixibacteria bacterium]
MAKPISAKSHAFDEEMRRLYSEFSQMKNRVMLNALNVWHPQTDVCETEDELIITCELAGVRKEDIKIQIDDNILTISGTRKERKPLSKAVFHNLEINYGQFERSIRFPNRFMGADPNANFKEGILCIKIPATPPEKRRKIDVEVE